jgi:virginiamycin B lyase
MSSLAVHPIDPAEGGPYSVAVTDDGAVWCSLVHAGAVLRRDADGAVEVFPLAGAGGSGGAGAAGAAGAAGGSGAGSGAFEADGAAGASQPAQVAAAGEDTVWVADMAQNAVLLVGPAGVLRRVDAPSPGAQPYGVVSLGDGTAWFTQMGNDSLGRIGILGGVAEFAAGTIDGVLSMIAASGESLWFTANRANLVGYVRGGDAAPALYPLPTPEAGPVGITVGDWRERSDGSIARGGSPSIRCPTAGRSRMPSCATRGRTPGPG